MNGKKGSDVRIDIRTAAKPVVKEPEPGQKGDECFSFKGRVRSVWKFAQDDPKRVAFALKVGLAMLLVSLLILIRAPYEIFGTNIIWSILTVAIMFEYTVGSTFNKGFNRALGSLLAGIIAVIVMQVAMASGHVGEPYIIGFSIFFIGALTSFMKLWPSLVQYEYGFRVTLFTYCLITVSGYRMGVPIKTAMDRLYTIAIGGLVAVLVNVLICPAWAGEELHQELVKSFGSIADSLEECVKKYLKDDGSGKPEFAKTVMDDFQDEPAFKKCKATLNSSSKFDSLANSAKWEPPHGRFSHFFYPWAEYVKVGAVLRYCAYEVMALHGCLHSEIQAPYNLRMAFQTEILDATSQAAELLRSLGRDVSSMKQTLQTTLLKRVHAATDRLQRSIDMHSYLLTAGHDLVPVDPAAKAPNNKLTASLSFNPRVTVEPVCGDVCGVLDAEATAPPRAAACTLARAESYHESMKKQQRRLYSWPSREVDEFEESGDELIVPRMRALESTAAMSLATFASLLIEFVVRLDHLVDAVDELAKLARFQQDADPHGSPPA